MKFAIAALLATTSAMKIEAQADGMPGGMSTSTGTAGGMSTTPTSWQIDLGICTSQQQCKTEGACCGMFTNSPGGGSASGLNICIPPGTSTTDGMYIPLQVGYVHSREVILNFNMLAKTGKDAGQGFAQKTCPAMAQTPAPKGISSTIGSFTMSTDCVYKQLWGTKLNVLRDSKGEITAIKGPGTFNLLFQKVKDFSDKSIPSQPNSIGKFEIIPAQNSFYYATIVKKGDEYHWINGAGFDWKLNATQIAPPSIESFTVGTDCVYKSRWNQQIKVIRNSSGEITGIKGQGTSNQLFQKVENFSKDVPTQPNTWGKFEIIPPQNNYHYVTIVKKGDNYEWINLAGAHWSLTATTGGDSTN